MNTTCSDRGRVVAILQTMTTMSKNRSGFRAKINCKNDVKYSETAVHWASLMQCHFLLDS